VPAQDDEVSNDPANAGIPTPVRMDLLDDLSELIIFDVMIRYGGGKPLIVPRTRNLQVRAHERNGK
jgi:hypothetical protein